MEQTMKNGALKSVCGILTVFILMAGGCSSSSTQTQTVSENDANYHNKIGMAFLGEGKIQLAYVEFQKAIRIDPDNRDAIYNLGLTCFQLEDYESSKKYFQKAVKLAPDFPDAHNNLGVTLMQLRQWQEAADSFSRAIANPFYKTPELAFYSLGMALYRMGQYEKAVDSFKDSIRRDRKFILPYYGMALAYNKMGKYGEAAELMAKAIETDVDYKGDREKKASDLKDRLYIAKGEEEKDLRDLLEIMQY
jgi:type IV pilus biogenesis/stability protein PilW